MNFVVCSSLRCRLLLLLLAAVLTSAGCASLGPRTLDRDQLDYGHSVGQNWKNQLLANLVRLRYIDMPVFVDVGQIVGGYTLETQVNGNLGWASGLGGSNSQGLGASGRYTDRPTITYTPKTGEDYLRSLLEPINPASVLAMVAAGYSPDLLFTWAVESVNGLHNFTTPRHGARLADPGFYEFVAALGELQLSGAIGFEIESDPETGQSIVIVIDNVHETDAEREKIGRVRDLLGLEPGRSQYPILYSPVPVGGDTLAMQTRSIMQMMAALSAFVNVPPDKSGRALNGMEMPAGMKRPFTVYSSPDRPEDPFASFFYHGDWYWIDHEDLDSKRVFTLMLFLTTLTNRSGDEAAPVLTIPTN